MTMKETKALLVVLCLSWTYLLGAAPAKAADEIVVDLSDTLVAITAGFQGSDLLLFGALDGNEEGDVIVILRGPPKNELVRRKEKFFGVWVNRDQMTFRGIPGFYAVASSRPLEELLPEEELLERQIGPSRLHLAPIESRPSAKRLKEFRSALIRNKERQGLFEPSEKKVLFLGNRLFRTQLSFPANVAIGAYSAEVLLVRNKAVVAKSTSLLSVRKFGIEASIFDMAHRHSLSYGVLATLIAMMAGWVAGAIFRKS
jgi:uncharacterized protein (TIGR02186 family)